MPDWSLGSLILGIIVLPFVLSPLGAHVIRTTAAIIVAFIWPNRGWCDSMLWKDLPDRGPLHDCSRGCVAALRQIGHQQRSACWEGLLKAVFNRTWPIRRIRAVRKPNELDFGSRFFQTDIRTLFAFALCSARPFKGWLSFGEGRKLHLQLNNTGLEVREYAGVLVGHIEAEFECYQLRLSKVECRQIIMGYPPFYREECKTYEGVRFIHPSMEQGGIRRGGWVIALGLTDAIPTAVYASSMKPCFDEACCRVRDVVCDYLQHDVHGDSFETAKQLLQFMCANRSGSGALSSERLPHGELRELVTNGKCSHGLTAELCAFAVSIFDRKERLSHEDCHRLRPILVPILAAAVHGVHIVYQYVNNESTELERGAQALFVDNPLVYLSDCTGIQY